MKTKAFTSILVLFLLGFATQLVATAQSARGSYQFTLEDGYTRYMEFDARAQSEGSATGQVFFSDESEITYQDVDGTEDPEFKESYKGFSIKAVFDGMVVDRNQAVMSGTVSDSNIRNFIGQRVLLTVADNGDNTKEPDQLTWGLYQPFVRDWTPADAELEKDDGWQMRWTASDAEREDDKGIPNQRDEPITAQSFPLSSYSFVEVERGAGDIVVEP